MKHPPQSTLELSLFWNGDRIALRCLDAPGEIAVGDRPDSLARIPCEGVRGAGFVAARRSAEASLASIPEGHMATLHRASGELSLLEGPEDVPLSPGDAFSLVLGDFTLLTRLSLHEPVAAPAGRGRARGAWAHVAAAALAHLVALGLAFHAAEAREADEPESEQRDDLRALLVSAEERMLLRAPVKVDGPGGLAGAEVNQRQGDGRAGGGERAAGKAGSMGEVESRASKQARFAIAEKKKRDPERVLTRQEALADAAEFGMIGVVGNDAAAESAPESPWAKASEALGADALPARGAMWGDWQGSYQGYRGLELSGIGEGGGGVGEGIGLGAIGTLGHGLGKPGDGTGGAGSPSGGSFSFWGDRASLGGIGRGGRGSGHGVLPKPRVWTTWGGAYGHMVTGRLPPESVLRILRANWGRIRLCYENGLRRNPTLAGRVVVRFIIGRDGSVNNSADGGSTLPDPEVVSCIVRAFYGLSFPQPEGGIVHVTYPILLSPA